MNGHIKLIIGPMFSSKTSGLIMMVRRYVVAKKKCIVIKYVGDKRYTDKPKIVSHDNISYQAMECGKTLSLLTDLSQYDVIAIDEGQFFADLVEFCEKWANKGKIVLVAGLDGDFKREPFGQMCQLVSKAEEIQKLKAICQKCYKDASFSQRIINSEEVEFIGGSESYIAVCRSCYFSQKN